MLQMADSGVKPSNGEEVTEWRESSDSISLKFCRLSFCLIMRNLYLSLYRNSKLASESNNYIDYTCKASALGAKRIYQYHAMPQRVQRHRASNSLT